MAKDMVNHPDHYISREGLEVIDVIEAFTEGLDGIKAVCTGNVIKYICRWQHKNGLEDLKKAQWYLNHLIDIVETDEAVDEEMMNIYKPSKDKKCDLKGFEDRECVVGFCEVCDVLAEKDAVSKGEPNDIWEEEQ